MNGWKPAIPTLVLVLLTVTLTPVTAQEKTGPSDNVTTEVQIRPSEIKRPEDFAPAERIVSGRDTRDFRREGTFLSKASREIPKVDEGGLLERKYAMYEGRRFYQGPSRSAEERNSPRAVAVREKLAAVAAAVSGGRFGWIGWTLLGVIAAAVLVAWHRGWFVPFSERAAEKRRASPAAAGKRRRRETGEPQIELVRRG